MFPTLPGNTCCVRRPHSMPPPIAHVVRVPSLFVASHPRMYVMYYTTLPARKFGNIGVLKKTQIKMTLFYPFSPPAPYLVHMRVRNHRIFNRLYTSLAIVPSRNAIIMSDVYEMFCRISSNNNKSSFDNVRAILVRRREYRD